MVTQTREMAEFVEDDDYRYPLVSGFSCKQCDFPFLVDVGLVKSKSAKRTRRVRRYLCPICLSSTIQPRQTGERKIISYVTAVNYRTGGVEFARGT